MARCVEEVLSCHTRQIVVVPSWEQFEALATDLAIHLDPGFAERLCSIGQAQSDSADNLAQLSFASFNAA